MKLQNLSFKAKLLLSICVPLMFAVIIGLVAFVNLRLLKKANHWVDHTHSVINSAENIIESAVNMETGMRGYLLAGKEEFLASYNDGNKKIYEQIALLQKKVSDNPAQILQLDKVETVIKEWQQNVAEPNIKFRREIGNSKTIQDMADLIIQAKGKVYFDDFRKKMATFKGEEERLLKIRRANDQATMRNTHWIIIISIITALVFGLVFAVLITSSIQKQVGGEPEEIAEIACKVAQGDLEITLNESKTSGILAALVQMISVLKGLVNEVKHVAVEVKEGKIATRGNISMSMN